jgi:hypothetical protein
MYLHSLEWFILAVTEESQEWVQLILPASVTVGIKEERDDQLQIESLAGAKLKEVINIPKFAHDVRRQACRGLNQPIHHPTEPAYQGSSDRGEKLE